MHFLRPHWFVLLLPAAWICWRLWHMSWGQERWESICDAHLLPHLGVDQAEKRKNWSVGSIGLILLCAIIALSGPTWRKRDIPVFSNIAPVVILFDMSSAMLAKDITPNRLQRAKFKIIDLLKRRKSGQTALVAFTKEPFVVAPLTEDFSTITNLLPALEPTIMPVQGYNLETALQKAQQLIQQAGSLHGNILVISANGASLAAIDQAKKLAQKDTRVSVLGVGTVVGGPITLDNGQLLKDASGNVISAHLDLSALQKLASAGAGKYVSLTSDNADVKGLESEITRQGHGKITSNSALLWQDDGHWFLLFILPLMLLAFRRGVLL